MYAQLIGWIVLHLICRCKLNWLNVLLNCKMRYQWYSIHTRQTTSLHVWDHLTYDLQRVAKYSNVPRLTANKCIPPTHVHIVPSSEITVECTGFVKICCTLCMSALTVRRFIYVGIIASLRRDDEPGNLLTVVRCRLDRSMTANNICNELSIAISTAPYMTTNVSLIKTVSWWFCNHLLLNNWRNIETMSQRAPHLRLLGSGDPYVDFRRKRQELRLSHDGTGWYIVSQRR